MKHILQKFYKVKCVICGNDFVSVGKAAKFCGECNSQRTISRQVAKRFKNRKCA